LTSKKKFEINETGRISEKGKGGKIDKKTAQNRIP